MAAKMPTIAITTNSSISVKEYCFFIYDVVNLLLIISFGVSNFY